MAPIQTVVKISLNQYIEKMSSAEDFIWLP